MDYRERAVELCDILADGLDKTINERDRIHLFEAASKAFLKASLKGDNIEESFKQIYEECDKDFAMASARDRIMGYLNEATLAMCESGSRNPRDVYEVLSGTYTALVTPFIQLNKISGIDLRDEINRRLRGLCTRLEMG